MTNHEHPSAEYIAELGLDHFNPGIMHLVRENTGMNIGAWDWAWQQNKDNGYNGYLFLQDEINILKQDWLLAFTEKAETLNRKSASKFYLIGETWNTRWQQPWHVLRESPLNKPAPGHPPGIGRVDYYLECLKQWNIPAGKDGGHLRSLCWFSNYATLNQIGGFHQGNSYGECIASEIATSKKILALNGQVEQLSKKPFKYLWHSEWRRDGKAKL